MIRTFQRAMNTSIQKRLNFIKNEIEEHCAKVSVERIPRLIAVSKTKTEEDIVAAYDAGQRDFGENYANELKLKSVALFEQCPEIRWHFIGTVQKKQLNAILKSKNLVEIETVGSFKLIEMIEKRLSEGSSIRLSKRLWREFHKIKNPMKVFFFFQSCRTL